MLAKRLEDRHYARSLGDWPVHQASRHQQRSIVDQVPDHVAFPTGEILREHRFDGDEDRISQVDGPEAQEVVHGDEMEPQVHAIAQHMNDDALPALRLYDVELGYLYAAQAFARQGALRERVVLPHRDGTWLVPVPFVAQTHARGLRPQRRQQVKIVHDHDIGALLRERVQHRPLVVVARKGVTTRTALLKHSAQFEDRAAQRYVHHRVLLLTQVRKRMAPLQARVDYLQRPFHAVKEHHPRLGELVAVGAIEQGASKVNDYLIVAISSEGTVRNGAGDTIKMELMDILKGDYVNPHVSIWWYKLDSIDEVADPDKWLKANPNLGKTVSYETYQLDVERAEKAPAARNDILAKRFGLPMEGYTYYFTYEETLPHRHRDYWQMPCSLGADLSQGDDFCAFTFLFPLSNGSFGVKTRNYISSLTLMKLPAAMRIKYDQFMKEGSLIVLEGTVLDMMEVYEDLDNHIIECGYDVRCFGYDPYNAKEFVERWASENGPFGIEKVIQGAKTESVPLGELKKLSEERMLLFDEDLMTFAMGNCITLEDTNGNRKLLKKRYEQKIDAVAAMMDAYIAFKANREAFE